MWTDIVEQYQRREAWVSQYADELALVETRRQDVVEAEVALCAAGSGSSAVVPAAFHSRRFSSHVASPSAPQAMWYGVSPCGTGVRCRQQRSH